jgi:hypothetical protein
MKKTLLSFILIAAFGIGATTSTLNIFNKIEYNSSEIIKTPIVTNKSCCSKMSEKSPKSNVKFEKEISTDKSCCSKK